MKNRDLNKNLFEISLVIILLLAILLSCQSLKYGKVVEKWHEPATRQTRMMPMVIPTGKTNSVLFMPYIVCDNEDWCIRVNGVGTKGDTLTKKFYVSKEEFDTLNVGQFICVNGSCEKDTNNVKFRK